MNKKNKYKWFTLIEVIMVLAIVSILMLTLKSFFQIKNKEQYYGQVCTTTLYGQVSNFVYQWITSKLIKTGSTTIVPVTYYITFDSVVNSIVLSYLSESGTTWIVKSFYFSGNDLKSYYCQSSSYTIFLTWINKLSIEIDKWLQEKNTNLDVFRIKDQSQNQYITWKVSFILCDKQNILCKPLSEFIIDKRIHNIINKSCLTWSSTGSCDERDQ